MTILDSAICELFASLVLSKPTVNNKIVHAPPTEHRALHHKLKLCTVPFLYRSDLVKSRRMLYSLGVCNCTMPYVPRTVPAYAVPDPAYTAEVFALTLVEIDVIHQVHSTRIHEVDFVQFSLKSIF